MLFVRVSLHVVDYRLSSCRQMSDSDDLSAAAPTTSGRKLRRDSSMRKKRCSLGSSTIAAAIDVANAANAAKAANATAESDSLNENLSAATIQGAAEIHVF